MALPAYDQCIKASHAFNLLDARGVIAVTERQRYILRVRELAKACGAAWLKTAGGGSPFPRVSGGRWSAKRADEGVILRFPLIRRFARHLLPQAGEGLAGAFCTIVD